MSVFRLATQIFSPKVALICVDCANFIALIRLLSLSTLLLASVYGGFYDAALYNAANGRGVVNIDKDAILEQTDSPLIVGDVSPTGAINITEEDENDLAHG